MPPDAEDNWLEVAAMTRAPSDFHPDPLLKKQLPRPGADWWLQSWCSDPLPRPVPEPRQDQETGEEALEGDKSQACRQKGAGLQPSQDLWSDHNNERKKKGRVFGNLGDQGCCPITKNVVALDSAN